MGSRHLQITAFCFYLDLTPSSSFFRIASPFEPEELTPPPFTLRFIGGRHELIQNSCVYSHSSAVVLPALSSTCAPPSHTHGLLSLQEPGLLHHPQRGLSASDQQRAANSERLFCLPAASNSLNPQITFQPCGFVYRALNLQVFIVQPSLWGKFPPVPEEFHSNPGVCLANCWVYLFSRGSGQTKPVFQIRAVVILSGVHYFDK